MNKQEQDHLTRIVERCKAINAQVQELKWEAKELTEAAWEKCGVKPKVVKQLAKEAAWDNVQREEQRQLEESLDECRAALGLLAELPLGQAAQSELANHDGLGTVPSHVANGNGNGHGEPEKRGRGRPKGSRNKPKAPPAAESYAPPPPMPDWPQ